MWMYVCGVDSHGNQKLSEIFLLDQGEGFPLHCDPSLKEGKCVCTSLCVHVYVCVCAHARMNTHTSMTLKEFQRMELFKTAEEIPTQMECPRYQDIIPRANC